MFEHDYIMRMIKDLGKFLALFIKKDTVDYVLPVDEENFTETDYLHKELITLLKQGKINEAENILYKNLNSENTKYLELALDFYERLNDFDDEFLEKNNFTRVEIEQGLKEIANEFGINLNAFFVDY
ncbi:MAG: DUF6483 family protein [bacterium]